MQRNCDCGTKSDEFAIFRFSSLEEPLVSMSGGPPEMKLLRFITENRIHVLNVAGPRASKEREVAAFVREVLERTRAAA
jgi:hypothetical protein